MNICRETLNLVKIGKEKMRSTLNEDMIMYCCRRHIVAIKSLLCNTQCFHIADSATQCFQIADSATKCFHIADSVTNVFKLLIEPLNVFKLL